MKRNMLALAVLIFVPLLLPAQQSAPEIKFDSTPNLLKLPPDLYLGEASGVATNSKGHIFVFSRGNSTGPAYAATASQLPEFDKDGKFLREIGHNLHALVARAQSFESISKTISGPLTKARTWSLNSRPTGAWPWSSAASRKPRTKEPNL